MSQSEPAPLPAQRTDHRRRWRIVLAGPIVFVCAALVMCGGALWLPKGPAQIDNIVLPIVLLPAIWALLFFYACLDRRLGRAWGVVGTLALAHAVLIAVHMMRAGAAA
jgi:hypothetical protein